MSHPRFVARAAARLRYASPLSSSPNNGLLVFLVLSISVVSLDLASSNPCDIFFSRHHFGLFEHSEYSRFEFGLPCEASFRASSRIAYKLVLKSDLRRRNRNAYCPLTPAEVTVKNPLAIGGPAGRESVIANRRIGHKHHIATPFAAYVTDLPESCVSPNSPPFPQSFQILQDAIFAFERRLRNVVVQSSILQLSSCSS
ncbi:hypothetical protein MRX96_052265 [Rhipicephalus microplus]